MTATCLLVGRRSSDNYKISQQQKRVMDVLEERMGICNTGKWQVMLDDKIGQALVSQGVKWW